MQFTSSVTLLFSSTQVTVRVCTPVPHVTEHCKVKMNYMKICCQMYKSITQLCQAFVILKISSIVKTSHLHKDKIRKSNMYAQISMLRKNKHFFKRFNWDKIIINKPNVPLTTFSSIRTSVVFMANSKGGSTPYEKSTLPINDSLLP